MATEEKNKGGRPFGSTNRLAREARETARKTGDGRLPHEILLDIARGHPVELLQVDDRGKLMVDEHGIAVKRMVIPDLPAVQDAAKAAAPYFAPKISTVEVIQGISDYDLDSIIDRAAAEAGVSLSIDGEGTESEGEGSEPERAEPEAEVSSGRRRARFNP